MILGPDFPWGFVGTIFAALMLFIGGYVTVRGTKANSRLDHQQRGYDQLQEDNETLRNERDHAKNASLAADRRARVLDDYAEKLRAQVRILGGAPNDYPEELNK